ncbi:unnamed protein product [Paramecium octaurelia]|uniref:Uncharacterized protein n=1 Tax=Paramecium octaurelia TaxID=43137 RepID=A0A8S1SMA6_PAROT|nr:unnamed protein product [Paramecium octaurelia]
MKISSLYTDVGLKAGLLKELSQSYWIQKHCNQNKQKGSNLQNWRRWSLIINADLIGGGYQNSHGYKYGKWREIGDDFTKYKNQQQPIFSDSRRRILIGQKQSYGNIFEARWRQLIQTYLKYHNKICKKVDSILIKEKQILQKMKSGMNQVRGFQSILKLAFFINRVFIIRSQYQQQLSTNDSSLTNYDSIMFSHREYLI